MQVERGTPGSPAFGKRVASLPLALAGVLPMLLAITALLANPSGYIYQRAFDDSFYYLQIAEHIVNGQGSTFDGVIPTNGYHPLWMLVCVLVRGCIADQWTYALALGWIQVVIASVGIYLIARSWRSSFGPTWAVCAALVVAADSFWAFVNLMESGINLLFLGLLSLLVTRLEKDGPAPRVALVALALAGAIYARLDNAVIVLGILAGLVASATTNGQTRRQALLWSAQVAAMTFLLVLPYLLWNQLAFGDVVPVSGLVKQLLAFHPGIEPSALKRAISALLGTFHLDFGALTYLCIWTGVPTLTYCIVKAVRTKDRRQWIQAAVLLGVLGHFAFYALTSVEGIYAWYALPYSIVSVFMLFSAAKYVVVLVGKVRRTSIPPIGLRAALPVLAILLFGARSALEIRVAATAESFPRSPWVVQVQALASAIPSARAAAWNAGISGYAFGGRVTNLDGRVNSREYVDNYLSEYRTIDYILDKGFDFLIDGDQFLGMETKRNQRWPGMTDESYYRLLTSYVVCIEIKRQALPSIMVLARKDMHYEGCSYPNPSPSRDDLYW